MPNMVSVADEMAQPLLLVMSASVSSTSRSDRWGDFAEDQKGDAMRVEHLRLRTLPLGPLLHANIEDPEISNAVQLLDQAQGVIVVTPTCKGTCSGLGL